MNNHSFLDSTAIHKACGQIMCYSKYIELLQRLSEKSTVLKDVSTSEEV